MYKIKEDVAKIIREKYKLSYLTKNAGVTRQHIYTILNKGQVCSKVVAYCITKCIDKNAEIDDYFIKI